MIELLILVAAGFGIAAGSFYLGWKHYERQMLVMVGDLLEEIVVDLVVEQVDGQYFLYQQEDGKFVGQADTIQNLAEVFVLQLGSEKIGRVTGADTFSIIDGRIERAEPAEQQ